MDERERIAEMIGADLKTTAGKANVMRVILGYIDPAENQRVICQCGYRGTIIDCHQHRYSSDAESWEHLAGRAGWVWKCPQCSEKVWKYYNVIS